jgi:predicted peptidase
MDNDRCGLKYVLFIFIAFISTRAFSQSEVKGTITAEIIQKKQLGYLLHLPKNTKEKKPLIIFLHGDGEKGTDTEKVKIHGPFKYLKSHDIDAYVLAPQCPENELWDTEMVYRLILKIQKENNIDSNRIYLTGLSSGGWAVWNLGILHHDMFAALVPISGFADLILMDDICKVKAIPIRIFNGLLDDVVSVNYATEVYKNLRACNANAALTIFEDSGHDSWTRVYDNPEIYDWMLQQVKKP